MDNKPPGSSVHGILQAIVLKCVMMPFSRGSSQPRDQICISCVPCTAGRFFTTERWGEVVRYIHSQMLKGDTYRQITYYRSDLLDIKEDAKESHQKQNVSLGILCSSASKSSSYLGEILQCKRPQLLLQKLN